MKKNRQHQQTPYNIMIALQTACDTKPQSIAICNRLGIRADHEKFTCQPTIRI